MPFIKENKVVAEEVVNKACQNTEKVAKIALGATPWNLTDPDSKLIAIAKGTSVLGLRLAMKYDPKTKAVMHALNPTLSKCITV